VAIAQQDKETLVVMGPRLRGDDGWRPRYFFAIRSTKVLPPFIL